MARIIHSPNPDFKKVEVPSDIPNYSHPIQTRNNRLIPVAFQVTSPFNRLKVLLPHSLVLHVNPSSFQESFNAKIEKFQTRGGWQEQHWGQDLVAISAGGSTGAFVNIYTGLTSVLRQRTIAWNRYRDLHDLFKHNGSVYDPSGSIVLQGNIMIMYDRGVFIGTFRTFDVEETDSSPFAFSVSWTFKIEHTISMVHHTLMDSVMNQMGGIGALAPEFQSKNIPVTTGASNNSVTASDVEQRERSEELAEQRRDSMDGK